MIVTFTLLQIVLAVVIVVGMVVFAASFYIIRKVANSPANGELGRLGKLEEAIGKHTNTIGQHLLHRGHHYGNNQHKHG